MRILIDGYNLLHAIGYHGDLSEPGVLESARVRMLEKLSQYLTEEERKNSLVIFDAGHRSKDLEQQYVRDLIRVEFAMDHLDADSKIQELIRDDNVPKQLLVVSSDHRIQRTARARHASFLDSDQWLVLLESRLQSVSAEADPDATLKPETENDYWMELFSSVSVEELREELRTSDLFADEEVDNDDFQNDKPNLPDDLDIFPPGYGEDLC